MSEIIAKLNASFERKSVPEIRTGDRVRVHQKVREGKKERVQVFEGIVIKTAGGKSINGSFTVRCIASGVGVEKSFPLHLPSIVKIEKLKSAKVRQARIYYIRERIGKAATRMKGEKASAGLWEETVETQEEAPKKAEEAEKKEEDKVEKAGEQEKSKAE